MTSDTEPALPASDLSIFGPRPSTTTHLGRAGEHLVAGHLLRLGYNAMPLPVDTGVDLLAHWTTRSGDSRVAQFQVKSTERRRLTFRLTEKQLNRWWAEMINLVVVFWYEATAPFCVVLPPSLCYMLTSGGYKDRRAPIRVAETLTTIVVASPGPQRVYIGNRHNDISRMVNRFDRIEATDDDPLHIPRYACWASDGMALVQLDE
jgi:hypothetical protein